jgi:hypothetical protein
MVVPVLMMSCHVSEYAKIGPVAAQITMTATAAAKTAGLPAADDMALAPWLNARDSAPGFFLLGILLSYDVW